jgi:hypothetical protein
MIAYAQLWRVIEVRLRAAFSLMHADAPALANGIASSFESWLSHNELELALDELLDAADDASSGLRRRFWEELLTAAMHMRLAPQFARLADRIEGLEPHIFSVDQDPPHVSCDFNGFIESDVYSLDSVTTALDFARLRRIPNPGQRVVLYDADDVIDGATIWLLVDAEIVEFPPWGLVAKADRGSYRQAKR